MIGSRIPAVFLHEKFGNDTHRSLEVQSDQGTDMFHQITTKKPLGLEKWHRMKISQTFSGDTYVFSVLLNGELDHSSVNTIPRTYTDVKVYISDPWFPNLRGFVRNLSIETQGTFTKQCFFLPHYDV